MPLIALAPALFAIVRVVRPPILLELWPLPRTGEGTFLFLASVSAAAAASIAWAATRCSPTSRSWA